MLTNKKGPARHLGAARAEWAIKSIIKHYRERVLEDTITILNRERCENLAILFLSEIICLIATINYVTELKIHITMYTYIKYVCV